MPRFLRKMILISSSKFCILRPFSNTQLYRRFDLGFWQTLEQVKGKSNMKKNLHKVSKPVSLSQKNGSVFVDQIWHYKAWTNIPLLRGSDSDCWQTSKRIYRKLQYREIAFGKFQGLPRFYAQKWFFIRWPNFTFWFLSQNLITSKIGFRLLTGSKTGL